MFNYRKYSKIFLGINILLCTILIFFIFKIFIDNVFDKKYFYIYLLYFFVSGFFSRCFKNKVCESHFLCSIMSCAFLAVSQIMYFIYMFKNKSSICSEYKPILFCGDSYIFNLSFLVIITLITQFLSVIYVENCLLNKKCIINFNK
jgi:hypothetical protein